MVTPSDISCAQRFHDESRKDLPAIHCYSFGYLTVYAFIFVVFSVSICFFKFPVFRVLSFSSGHFAKLKIRKQVKNGTGHFDVMFEFFVFRNGIKIQLINFNTKRGTWYVVIHCVELSC